MVNCTAIFDFDKTLIRQGSLLLILTALAGRPRVIGAALGAICTPSQNLTGTERLRAGLLRRLLPGVRAGDIADAAAQIYPQLDWNETVLARYHWHRAQGHRILIATGGLALYMPVLLAQHGLTPDGVLASEMILQDGVLTGEMDGPSCTGQEKARRVKDWLGPDAGECWGYGNLPKDGPMLALTAHPHSVHHGKMTAMTTAP